MVVYSGAEGGLGPFSNEIARFSPFSADVTGGVSVAGADIDGNALSDNIIVGAGPGADSQVKVFSSHLPAQSGSAPDVFSTFAPYPGSKAGVTLATGLIDSMSGRPSVVTAPGPGDPPHIKAFRWDLYEPTERAKANGAKDSPVGDPETTADFMAFDPSYTGGVSLTAGWVAGSEGGAQSVVTGQLGADGTVRVWSTGSRLDGQPTMYLHSPNHEADNLQFAQIAELKPFSPGPPGTGTLVATTSTTTGADLLVSRTGPAGAEVRKYTLARPDPAARTLVETLLTTLPPLPAGTGQAPLGGR